MHLPAVADAADQLEGGLRVTSGPALLVAVAVLLLALALALAVLALAVLALAVLALVVLFRALAATSAQRQGQGFTVVAPLTPFAVAGVIAAVCRHLQQAGQWAVGRQAGGYGVARVPEGAAHATCMFWRARWCALHRCTAAHACMRFARPLGGSASTCMGSR